jgi:hypothetical protein
MPSDVKITKPHNQCKVVWIEELDRFVEATMPDIC